MPSKPTTTFSTSLPVEGYKVALKDSFNHQPHPFETHPHWYFLFEAVIYNIAVLSYSPRRETVMASSRGRYPGFIVYARKVVIVADPVLRWRYDQIWQECNAVVRWDQVPCRDGGGATTA
ncbi:hypothetical protein RIF29_41722 [Crotalaria pallida]|uniref:Uncharacterized protein n=1 Tax=Crotalaria pallida TaxID=3830 RepID=A0AAN9E7W0_CROPI